MQLLDPGLARSAPKAGPVVKPPIDQPQGVGDLLQFTFAEISAVAPITQWQRRSSGANSDERTATWPT